jgi:hypothetical protein
MPVWERFAIIVEVALVCLLTFKLLTFGLELFVPASFFYIGIVTVHYLIILVCGFWTGWKIRIDGWLYAIIAFILFSFFRQLFKVYYPLPLAQNIKLLMFIPALALLFVGAVYGEIAAEKREDSKKEID